MESAIDAAQPAAAAAMIDDVLQRVAELSKECEHGPALVLLDRTVQADRNDARLHAARGWALENLGPARLREARAAYETAVALDAGELWAQAGLANVLGQLGLTACCAPIYRDVALQAAARAPREPEFIELLGWCHYRLGRLVEAADTFARALAIDTTWVSVRFDLGLVLLLRGDADGAIEHYRGALHALAGRGPRQRPGPLKVALDDLDDALAQQPSLCTTPAAIGIRARLEQAANAHAPSHV